MYFSLNPVILAFAESVNIDIVVEIVKLNFFKSRTLPLSTDVHYLVVTPDR